jgi:PAS domain S-box-containing protein
VLAAPLYIDGRVEGFIVYFICEQQQRWLDAECGDLIGLLADMLANSVMRFRTTRDLVAIKERLRRGQMFANIGTWEGDLSSQTCFWSEQIAPLFGYPEDEEPSYQKLVQAIHPEDRERFQQAVYEGNRRGNAYEIEYRVVQQNQPDRIRWLLERGTLVTNEAGVPVKMLSVVQDITRAKQDEAALIAARNEAERASRAKSEFLSSMSHELRTPMNAILGFGQLMEYDQGLDSEHKESVHEILKAGRHLLDLINDILDLAKVEAGRLSLSLEPVCLQDVVSESVSLVTSLAKSNNIKINIDLQPGSRVLADKTRLKQVCLNILSNAVKYNVEGGSVSIRSEIYQPSTLRLTVEDTGKGISEAGLQILFLPFNRLDAESSGIEGTGIGLTLTKRMVELMGGSIGVVSRLGMGTRVWVELPLSQGIERQAQCHDASDEIASDSIFKPRTILYVDDNPVNLKLVKGLLRRFNSVEMLDAHTPDMGIELAKQHKPDLILLDINMPGLNGYQVLEILKKNPVFADTPVIALTANAMPREIEKGLDAGFSHYLTKPIVAAEFIQTLQEYL